jgi:hypothetical protein
MKLKTALDKLSPNQLALTATLGYLIVAACFIGPAPRSLHAHQYVVTVLFVGVATLLLAIISAIWAETRLKNGIQNNRWSEDQLTLLRRFTEIKGFGYLSGLSLLLCIVYAVYRSCNQSIDRHIGLTPPFWAGWVLAMYASRLRNLFVVRLRTSTYYRHRPIIASEFKPIQSNHWGQN